MEAFVPHYDAPCDSNVILKCHDAPAAVSSHNRRIWHIHYEKKNQKPHTVDDDQISFKIKIL